jgi:Mg-chelatase subunit ChlD
MAELNATAYTPSRASAGGHVLAASLAVAVSVVVHGLLVLAASRVDMHFASRQDYTPPERQHPDLQVGSVDLSPETQSRVLTALRELGQAEPPDVTKAVDEMQVAPEVGVTDPPSVKDIDLAPELAGVPEPALSPPSDRWMPRQEILAIEAVSVGDIPAGLERRIIPSFERVPVAPDIVLEASSLQVGDVRGDALPAPVPANLLRERVGAPAPAQDVERTVSVVRPESGRELFEEHPEDITDIEPVERVLTARVETFAGRRDSKYAYFRLVVERAGEQLLPVRPKDILLVQDSSASMAEQRLFFCREAMRRSLAQIGTADRFNVARFSDRTELCFSNWVTKTPETLAKAEAYINRMEAKGNTDLFASMQDLLALERQPGRPVIAFVVTDGLVNAGMTDSTDIIGSFTRKNQGAISVYTMGVSAQANRYLLDLLSFCNSGSTEIIESGRWDIPVAAEAVMHGVQRPVLAGLEMRFAADSSMEVYPRQVGNLYLDRPLVLYGRYRRDDPRLVFQAVGQAGTTRADMIFDLPLATPMDERSGGDPSIRESWGRQKIYHMLGEYTRARDKSVLKELRGTAREFGLAVPYRDAIGL